MLLITNFINKSHTIQLRSFQMETLAKLNGVTHSRNPYTQPIKVYIAAVKSEEGKTVLGLVDSTGVAKALCFTNKLTNKLILDSTVIVKNYQKGRTCLMFTDKTVISPGTTIKNIPDNYVQQAKDVVCPPPPEVVKLQDIMAPLPGSPPKRITVSGDIVQVRNYIHIFGVNI